MSADTHCGQFHPLIGRSATPRPLRAHAGLAGHLARLHAGQPGSEDCEQPAHRPAGAMVTGASPKFAPGSYRCPLVTVPHLSGKERGQSMPGTTLSPLPRAFASAVPANTDYPPPEYTSPGRRIPRPRHVSPPAILGNNLVTPSANCSGWPSPAEAPARIQGSFSECMAHMPSTLR